MLGCTKSARAAASSERPCSRYADGGLQQRRVRLGERPVDPVDQRAPGRAVAAEHALGQQVVGQHGPRRAGQARAATQAGERGPRRAAGVVQVRATAARSTTGPGPKSVGQRARRRPAGRCGAPRTTTSRSPWTPTSASAPRRGGPPGAARRRPRGLRGTGRASARATTATWSAPPQPSAAARERSDVVGLAAQQGVDHEGLEPGVPGAPGLGRAGVDLGGGEGDLAGVAQDGLAQLVLVTGRGQPGDLRPRRCRRRCGPSRGSAAGDRAGELAGGGAEDVGADLRAVRRPASRGLAEPGRRRRRCRPGRPGYPGPVLGAIARYQGSRSSIRRTAAVASGPALRATRVRVGRARRRAAGRAQAPALRRPLARSGCASAASGRGSGPARLGCASAPRAVAARRGRGRQVDRPG